MIGSPKAESLSTLFPKPKEPDSAREGLSPAGEVPREVSCVLARPRWWGDCNKVLYRPPRRPARNLFTVRAQRQPKPKIKSLALYRLS
jgi:hypothetical protein